MNKSDHPRHGDGNPECNDAVLPMQLRALRSEQLPSHDLWPGIAARISHVPRQPADDAGTVVPLRRSRTLRLAPFALAASLVLAVGVAWQQRPDLGPPPAGKDDAMMQRQAQALTREYEGALRELQAAGAPSAPVGATLQELDRSAAQIRTALARDPDARFLLDQLRRTYEKRLELTQRAILS